MAGLDVSAPVNWPVAQTISGLPRVLCVRCRRVGGYVALFDSEKTLVWIRGSLIDVIDREPEVRAPES
jgi:hypothetical protein